MALFGRKKKGSINYIPDSELQKLRAEIDQIIKLAGGIEKAAAESGLDDFSKFKEKVIEDMLLYLIYLSASDGEVSPAEVEVINKLLSSSVKLNQEDCLFAVKSRGLTSDEFQNTVPGSFIVLHSIAKEITDPGTAYQLGRQMKETYNDIGLAVIESDKDNTIEEKRALSNYLTQMDRYLNNNLM